MSIWLEIFCDVRAPCPEGMVCLDPFCYGESTRQVGGMAYNTRESVRRCLMSLEKQAKLAGWIKDRRGWVCPNCKTVNTVLLSI